MSRGILQYLHLPMSNHFNAFLRREWKIKVIKSDTFGHSEHFAGLPFVEKKVGKAGYLYAPISSRYWKFRLTTENAEENLFIN